FNNIEHSGERLLKLLNNLLDLSKLEAGKVDFKFEQNDIIACLNQVSTELNSLLNDKKLQVSIINNLKSSSLTFDRFTIVQVLINVVSNAIKFSPEGEEIIIKLEDTTQDAKEAVIISVEDHGVGIPEGELGLIFDKFTQSSKTNKGSGGTGLGLSIAQNIIAAHQGKIWAENGKSCGAIIKIMLFKEIL
ncbi:MAG: sensor histidine kinase, partial [Rickettsiales bacterium]